jgi:hypothetical protein
MLRGGRLRNVATGLAIVVAAVCLWFGLNRWLVPEPPDFAEREPFHVADSSYRPGGEQCDPERLRAIRSRSEREKQTAECNDQANQNSHDQSDLQQQWRSANAAEEMASTTYTQLRMSAVEATIIFLALCAAAWAAWAAHAGNVQDERQSRQQLRAYVTRAEFQEDRYEIAEHPWYVFRVMWRNCGQTPTRNFACVTNYDVFPSRNLPDDFDFRDRYDKLELPKDDRRGGGAARMLIGPGQELSGTAIIVSAAALNGIRGRGESLFAWGWAEYNDVFDNTPRHRTEFCVYAAVLNDDKGGFRLTWLPYPKHNGADEDCLKPLAPPLRD